MSNASHDRPPLLPEGLKFEGLFRALLADSPSHIYFKDQASRFILINAAMARWLGISSPEEALGRTDADFFSPAHSEAARMDEKALLNGYALSITKEEREGWPDGRETWVQTTKYPLFTAEGKTLGTFGISTDITERKRDEATLQATLLELHQLERVVNRSPSVAFVRCVDASWAIRYISDNINLFGYSSEDFLSGRRSFASILDPDDQMRVVQAVQDSLSRGEETLVLIYRIRTRDQQVRWIEEHSRLFQDASQSLQYYEGVLWDITDKQAAQELRESEERYRRLLASVTDYVYESVLCEGRIVQTRHGAGCEAVTGYTSAEYDSNPYLWYNMIVLEDRPPVLQAIDRVMKGLAVEPLEHRIVHKNGSPCWVRHTPVPHRNAEGVLIGIDGLIEDITRRRNAEDSHRIMERKMLESREQSLLERADRLSSLGLLAAGVAHEVNNPLQGMLSHVDNARHALPAGSPAKRSLDMVERGIQSIASLVQQLMWLGTNKPSLGETCRFMEAAVFVRDLLDRQMQKANVHIEIHTREADQSVSIPRKDLVQVLLNLLMNARDAMPAGGTVSLGCTCEGAQAAIRISDTGTGIAPEQMTRIFTPFYTTKGANGTGLGLTVADSLIRASHGRIEVESVLGQGTLFTLYLPLAQETV